MDEPWIAGVAGGVGTSVLAAALRAYDAGICFDDVDGPVDVLVARSTMHSLGAAQRALTRMPPTSLVPDPPVLAVVADGPGASLSSTMRARVRMTEPHVAAVVLVPFVAEWRDLDDPLAAARAVLADSEVPRSLRGFVTALHALIDEVTPRVLHRSQHAPSTPLSNGAAAHVRPQVTEGRMALGR